jgi:hypothetical protein
MPVNSKKDANICSPSAAGQRPLLFAGHAVKSSADATYPFIGNRNFEYLTESRKSIPPY